MDFSPLDVVIGGSYGYAEHINTGGVFQQHIELRDDDDNLMKVWGSTFTPDGEAHFALGQRGSYEDYTPHDVCYIPGTDPHKLAALIGRTNNTVELWITDTDYNILQTITGLNKDTGWVYTTPLKLAIACNGDTVYYTDQGRTIFKLSLATGLNLANHAQLSVGSPYIYGGIDVQPDGDIYVAMTTTGTGPRRDVCLGGASHVWTDVVNPISTYRAYKRNITDGSEVLNHVVRLNPANVNDEILSLACYYYPCVAARMMMNVTVIGAN